MTLAHVSQTCTIAGRAYRVHGSSVEYSLNSVPRIQFAVDADANTLEPIPRFGEEVVLTQIGDGAQVFRGTIVDLAPIRGSNFTQYLVGAEGLTGLAAYRRFLDIVPAGSASSVISAIWNLYGPPTVNFLYDPSTDDLGLGEYASTYGSVSDFLNFVTNSTALAWRDEGNVIRVLDPESQPLGAEITQRDFAKGSLRANYSGASVFNLARTQAWEFTTVQFNNPMMPEDVRRRAWDTVQVLYCATRFKGPPTIAGLSYDQWEFVNGRVVRGRVAESNTPLSQIEVSFDEGEKAVTTSLGLLASPGEGVIGFTSSVLVEGIFRRPVWVEAGRQDSITRYGLRESPVLPNGGDMDVSQELDHLENFLNLVSHPPLEVSGEYLRTDIRPGERRRLDLPDLGVSGTFVVERVRRTHGGNMLQVEAVFRELVAIAGGREVRPLSSKPDPLPEVLKRLERLEGTRLDVTSHLGTVWLPGGEQGGPIGSLARFEGGVGWSGEFEAEMIVGSLLLREDF